MRLITILKFIFICLASVIIFLGTPLLVGQFTMQTDILMLSFFVGGGLAGMFAIYMRTFLMPSTLKYCNKKQGERQHE
jgi:uncharacterized integral membrane protein